MLTAELKYNVGAAQKSVLLLCKASTTTNFNHATGQN